MIEDENLSRNAGIGTMGSQYDSNETSDNEWRHEQFLDVGGKGPVKSVSTPSMHAYAKQAEATRITAEERQLIERAALTERKHKK
jgi:ligand-binding SRPBCC domain-containing protein